MKTKAKSWLDAKVSQRCWWKSDVVMGKNVCWSQKEFYVKGSPRMGLEGTRGARNKTVEKFQWDAEISKVTRNVSLTTTLSSLPPFVTFAIDDFGEFVFFWIYRTALNLGFRRHWPDSVIIAATAIVLLCASQFQNWRLWRILETKYFFDFRLSQEKMFSRKACNWTLSCLSPYVLLHSKNICCMQLSKISSSICELSAFYNPVGGLNP